MRSERQLLDVTGVVRELAEDVRRSKRQRREHHFATVRCPHGIHNQVATREFRQVVTSNIENP